MISDQQSQTSRTDSQAKKTVLDPPKYIHKQSTKGSTENIQQLSTEDSNKNIQTTYSRKRWMHV